MLNREAREIVAKHAIRFGLPIGRALLNLEVFATKVGLIENNGLTIGKNPNSTAKGLYQFLDGSLEVAVRRAAKTIGMLPWMIEAHVHRNANLLSRDQQTTLFLADMLEKKGSDKYTSEIMDKGCRSAMLLAYLELHHTNPDEATRRRAERIIYREG